MAVVIPRIDGPPTVFVEDPCDKFPLLQTVEGITDDRRFLDWLLQRGTKAPSVAVVTATTGNVAVARAIDSVAKQTYRTFKHFVVIDGASRAAAFHSTLRAAGSRGFIVTHELLEIVTLPTASGTHGFNGHRVYSMSVAGLVAAHDYVVFLDEDNWMEPDHLERLVFSMLVGQLDWAFSLRRVFTKDGKFVTFDYTESTGDVYIHRDPRTGAASAPPLVDLNCYMLKRSLLLPLLPLFERPARPRSPNGAVDLSLEVDRVLFQHILGARHACTGYYSLNYSCGNRPDSVSAEFFLAREHQLLGSLKPQRFTEIPEHLRFDPLALRMVSERFAWKIAPRIPIYLFHFGLAQTIKCLSMFRGGGGSISAHMALDRWHMGLRYLVDEDLFELHNGFYERTTLGGKIALVHMCHVNAIPWHRLIQFRERILYTIESPNARHTDNWSQSTLRIFTGMLTYWYRVLQHETLQKDFAGALGFAPYPPRAITPQLCDQLCVENEDSTLRKVCMCLEPRATDPKPYDILDVQLKPLDHLRKDLVGDLEITCFGSAGAWNAAYPSESRPKTLTVVETAQQDDRVSAIQRTKDFTFALTLENCNAVGYLSEKAWDAWCAGAIPLVTCDIAAHPILRELIPPDMYVYVGDCTKSQQVKDRLDGMKDDEIQRRKDCVLTHRAAVACACADYIRAKMTAVLEFVSNIGDNSVAELCKSDAGCEEFVALCGIKAANFGTDHGSHGGSGRGGRIKRVSGPHRGSGGAV